MKAGDPWGGGDLLDPTSFASMLQTGQKPVVLCVGVALLYRSAHIVGAKYAGPASNPDGLALLRQTARDLPRDQPLVIYCGCCPWQHCPNIRPAYAALKKLGFQKIRVLALPTDFHHDWVEAGLPVAK
ncbi:MAG TPA: rhodanese-like domain-containing protein [Opitutaceae bacterium]|nr:rhodanese-like domain-containing protein [Opitutaceae bacterium]